MWIETDLIEEYIYGVIDRAEKENSPSGELLTMVMNRMLKEIDTYKMRELEEMVAKEMCK